MSQHETRKRVLIRIALLWAAVIAAFAASVHASTRARTSAPHPHVTAEPPPP